MYIIICLDDNNGLAFNHRRQSQDRIVAEDIRKTVGEKKLWITDYSRKLFQAVSNLEISENPKEEAKKGEYVFQELETLDTDDEQIEQFIIYRSPRKKNKSVGSENGLKMSVSKMSKDITSYCIKKETVSDTLLRSWSAIADSLSVHGGFFSS